MEIPAAWRATPAGKTRLRGLGIAPEGRPGPCNAITDVAGVELGYTTLIEGEGPLEIGKGPVRTGVTAILPRGREGAWEPVLAGLSSFNGNGELTGSHWIEESGQLDGAVTITNTHSVGVARDAATRWLRRTWGHKVNLWALPVAAETFDGELNDIDGHHVTEAHVLAAIEGARGGPIELGSVGGGTGMITYEFKAGCGSASREVELAGRTWTVGVFVQSNFGLRREFRPFGVPLGRSIRGDEIRSGRSMGSIIGVIATDLPLLPLQLKRLARRMPMGVARTGGFGHNGSGDIFLAFSTGNRLPTAPEGGLHSAAWLPQDAIDPVFEAVVQATEEAILDSMVANETLVGRDGNRAIALPHEALAGLRDAV
ncbi:L-aminopeptidase/D-esterase [Tistlia consotensis]|uniref:L-aminopeptidase/D-esterase n=1 Tax=Tistlia consotensis USBA 355 TaxID=560819 RepID=A0A1Y6CIV4_9PROT|nr:P1 family peptidase [Tistlia consotensis]SMF65638.1 L-aminopeptidase/D-esterase [Tistlia consotensis USBA 355]SNS03442.1 L-aminopeptidase/D-esterase [Tistlia consotensis]